MAIVRMQQRRDTALNWSTYNPVLRQGELGFDTNARKFKIGDGETDWNGLDYLLEDEVAAALAAQGAAEDAQAAAEAAAAEAEATAESVIPTTDAAMTAVAGNPTSAFAIQQYASYEAKSGAVVAASANGVAAANSASANTTALNALHTAALALGAEIVLPPGTISTNGVTLKVPMRGAGQGRTTLLTNTSLTVSANGAGLGSMTVKASTAIALNLAHATDFTMRDVKVDFTNAVTTDWLAANLYDMDRLRVINCNFRIGGLQLSLCDDYLIDGNFWDCEYVNINEPCHVSGQSSGQFVNNTVTNSLTDGVDHYSSGHWCVIANNRFIGLKGGAGIECKVTMSDDPGNTSSPGNVFESTIIANNVLRDFCATSTGARTGIYAEYIDNRAAPAFSVAETNRGIIISGNIIEDMNVTDPGGGAVVDYWGITFTGHNGLITNNVIRNIRQWNSSAPVGIKLANPTNAKCVGVRVAGNSIVGIENGVGIESKSLDRCQIDDNIIRQDEANGGTITRFGVSFVTGAAVTGCSISGNVFELPHATSSMGIRTVGTGALTRCQVHRNVFKGCGVLLGPTQSTSFIGNTMDSGALNQVFTVGAAGTSSRGNIYMGNHITMSNEYALQLSDHDGFTICGNTFSTTKRAILLLATTKNGTITGNVSITQSIGPEFPLFSGVTAANQATVYVSGNVVNDALNFAQPGRLITVASIDAKTTGATTLYTVPTGRTAVITGAVVRCTAASSITVAPTLGIGVAAGEDDIFASTALTGLTATGKEWTFTSSGLAVTAAAGAAIKVGIDAAATGTSQALSIDLLGYLV